MSVEKEKTPWITWFKEGVTAILGISIIAGMFWLLLPSLTKEPADVQTAQAIFSILGGWGGIVLGYYFGRLPAERAATKAEAAASAAEIAKDAAVSDKKTTLTEARDKIIGSRERLEEYEKLLASLIERIEAL